MKLETYIAAPTDVHVKALQLLKQLEGYGSDELITVKDCMQMVAALYVAMTDKPETSDTSFNVQTDELGNRQISVTLGEHLNVKGDIR